MNPPPTNTQAGSGSLNPCQPAWKQRRSDAAVKAAYLLDVARG
jgi:hypothetical protein